MKQTGSKPLQPLVFSLLGPLEVRRGGEALPLGGQRQRALLAVLLLHANETVSRDRLVEGVWGDRPPTTKAAALNVYLSKVRKLVSAGSGVALVTESQGYVLQADPDCIDLHRFELLARRGRDELVAGQAAAASGCLGEALALWRGLPLGDLADTPSRTAAVGRLVELRLGMIEDRLEADLALGRHSELVPELEALVLEYPLRERLRAQLMTALYRGGRQSEALQAYRETRRLLAEELGIDPGPELQRLEKAILVHDPLLAGPPSADGRKSSRRRNRDRGRAAALAAVVAGIAALAITAPLLAPGRGDSDNSTPEPAREADTQTPASDVAVVQPETHKVVARVPVGSSPALIREGDGSVWVADQVDLTVTQIDPETRSVERTIGIGFRPDDLGAREGAVWAIDKEDGVLARLAGEQTWDRFKDPELAGMERLALDDEAVWLSGGTRLIRVDASTGKVVRRADLAVEVDAIALGGDDVWAVSGPAAAVLRIDRSTAAIRDRISIARGSGAGLSYPVTIAADDKLVWVLNGNTATVSKIDPARNGIVTTFRLDSARGSVRLATGEGAAWVTSDHDGTITRIDGRTDAVTAIRVSPPSSAQDVVVAGGLVWVSVDGTRYVQ
jgi:DNA-binding SARP family transcriptional activator/streptogramin lyase